MLPHSHRSGFHQSVSEGLTMTEQSLLQHMRFVVLLYPLCGLLYSGGALVWDDHDLSYLQQASIADLLFSPVGLANW